MRQKWWTFLLSGALVVGALSGCGGGSSGGGTSQPPSGGGGTEQPSGGQTAVDAEAIYQNTCSSCHGKDLSGGFGPDLRHIGAQLSKDEIVQIIEKGRGSMPAQQLNQDEAEAVATWLAEKK
ncbi:MAG: cytochrome c [Hydrogenibacillus sp.]|nr:cytochrome c [Hydrogenibacillus sp.]